MEKQAIVLNSPGPKQVVPRSSRLNPKGLEPGSSLLA
ncbi:MAG: hypothetical protein ACK4P4_21215 [Allorhizobium sp.]